MVAGPVSMKFFPVTGAGRILSGNLKIAVGCMRTAETSCLSERPDFGFKRPFLLFIERFIDDLKFLL